MMCPVIVYEFHNAGGKGGPWPTLTSEKDWPNHLKRQDK